MHFYLKAFGTPFVPSHNWHGPVIYLKFLICGSRQQLLEYGSWIIVVLIHRYPYIGLLSQPSENFAQVQSNEIFCANEQQEKSTHCIPPEKKGKLPRNNQRIKNYGATNTQQEIFIYISLEDISPASVTVKSTITLLYAMVITRLLLRDRVFDANRLVKTS